MGAGSSDCCSNRTKEAETKKGLDAGDELSPTPIKLEVSMERPDSGSREVSPSSPPDSPPWTLPVNARDFRTNTVDTEEPNYFINTDGIFVGNAVDDYTGTNCTLSTGSRVLVVEEVEMQEKKRVRGRIEEPEGWISLRNTETGHCFASPVEDGHAAYVVTTHGLLVGATVNDFTATVTTLGAGTRVVVVEEAELDQKKRVRGRILDPEGWISIRNTETRLTFVKSIEGREIELQFKAGPLGAEPGKRSGQITAVWPPDGQAKTLGVKVGWVLVRIGGDLYTDALFKTKVVGSAQPYMLTFANVEARKAE